MAQLTQGEALDALIAGQSIVSSNGDVINSLVSNVQNTDGSVSSVRKFYVSKEIEYTLEDFLSESFSSKE